MASDKQSDVTPKGDSGRKAANTGKDKPGWTGGLKQLYDSVVDEPIPDSFKDLLDKLDDNTMPPSDGETPGGEGSGQ